MEIRIGGLIAHFFLALLAIYIVMIPFAFAAVLLNGGGSINEDILVKTLGDILCEGDLMYINIIAVAICSVLNLMGIYPELQYRMNALPDFSLTAITVCCMGLLFLVCFIRVKLAVFSVIVRNELGMKKSQLIRAADASLTATGFLLSNLLTYWVNHSEYPLFWSLSICFICLIFIMVQHHTILGTLIGKDGYFGNLLRPAKDILDGILSAVSATLMVFFMYYMGTMYDYAWDVLQIFVLVITSYSGAYLAVVSMGDDISKMEKYGSLAVSSVLFLIMSGTVG